MLEKLSKAELKMLSHLAGMNSSPQFMFTSYVVRTVLMFAAIFTIIKTPKLTDTFGREVLPIIGFLMALDLVSSILACIGACCRKSDDLSDEKTGKCCQSLFGISSLVLTLIEWLLQLGFFMSIYLSG